MKKNILIFPAGAENALEIYDALRYNVNIQVYGASGKKDFAEYKYPADKYIEDELYITDPNFDIVFQSILTQYNIDIVIPTHDDIVLYLADKRDKFSAKILVSDYETARICREKRLMYELVRNENFCPRVHALDGIHSEDFPIFIKPNRGAGAVDARIIKNFSELPMDDSDYVITEYLSGEEVSVDCFTDRHGNLTFCGARKRDRIQMGIAFRSTTMEMTDEIYHIANTLNCKLKFLGAWYFQIKKDDAGKYKLLEFSCRQAGTMTLYRHLGVNFPMLGIFELLEVDTTFVLNEGKCQVERCLSNRFQYTCDYRTVYIDYDDTLIVGGKVCGIMIQFIFQCIDDKKKLVLLTRHEGDLDEDMAVHRISREIFDEVYHIDIDKSKVEYMTDENAILIDNSYKERKEVRNALGIKVFDVDMVDMLLHD